MTLADELHHALAVDAEPDLPAIRARVQRRQRRLHWAQGAAVAGLLAVVVGALVAIPRPGTVAFDNPGQSPVAPFAPSHESVGIEEVVILQVGSTVEVEAWIANHGDQAVTVVDLTLQAWDGSTWVPLPSPTPVVPTVVPGITRGIVQTTMRAESPLAEGWYAVVVGLEDRDLSLVVRRDGQQVQQAAVLPGVEGSSAYRGVALVPAPLGIAVTGSGEADVSLGPVTIARWDGAGWRDIPPAAGRAAALPPGLLLVPFDPASWQLHVGDPWMSSSAGTPPGWYRVTLGVTFPDGEQQALAVVTHRPWPAPSDMTASPSPCEVANCLSADQPLLAGSELIVPPLPETASPPSEPAVVPTEPTPRPIAGPFYVVQSGDTLSTIAEVVYGEAGYWGLLARANGVSDSNPLRIGQELTIPPAPERRPRACDHLSYATRSSIYIVVAGDTLASIAELVAPGAADELAVSNCVDATNPLAVGDELAIPIDDSVVPTGRPSA